MKNISTTFAEFTQTTVGACSVPTMPGGKVVKQPKKYVRRLTPLPGTACFIRKPLAPDSNSNPATAEILDPSDVDEDDDNLPIESCRPLPLDSRAEHAAEQILPATQKQDIPNFSVFSQNIYGAKLGVAAYRTAEEKRNGGKRFRESDKRTAKLDELRIALNKRNIMSDSRHDFVFLQELNTAISPEELLDRFPEYTIFAGTPHGSRRFYDTAVLVSTRFGLARLEEMASCTRATFVTVPNFGLLLVSVHGPFKKVREFHHDIISTVMLYQQAGWTPIVAGDFNLAPTPADRRGVVNFHGVAKRRGMTDSRGMAKRPEEGLMHLYTESLGLCNACEALTGLANPRSTISRSIYYTFKQRGKTGTPYVSRIDHILIPPHLLDIKSAKYNHIDVGSFSDHKELTLYAPQPLLGEFFSDASYEMAHDFPSDPVHLAKIEQILGRFDFTLTGRAAFERYRELLGNVLQYSRKQSDLQQNRLENKILWLREERMRLGNEQDGLGWEIYKDKIRNYEEQAVALAQKASLKVQEKTASVWLSDGDRNPVWQSLITRRRIDPRRQQAIFALQHISPTRFSAANSDSANTHLSSAHSLNSTQLSCIAGDTNGILHSTAAGLHAAVEYYFERAFEHEEPCQPSMETLCKSMLSDIDTRGCALTGAEIRAMPQTFEIIDIIAACKKAALLDAAGPNGVPSELYIHSQTAQKILHHLGNIWIRDPDSVPALFAEGSITLAYKDGDRTLLDNYQSTTLLNSDLKILTSIVAERIGALVRRLVSPEQFAMIPGRCITDGIYKLQAATKYLEITERQGAMVFLDQQKACDRISHTALFAVLDRIGIPAVYISAIKALYNVSSLRVILNGQLTKSFPIRRGVRQGDKLSCVLFVIAAELLGCAIRDNLPKEAKLNIPGANSSHVMYMDKTVVMLSSLKYWPDLKRGLDIYSRATTANFNFTNTEFVPFNYSSGEIPRNLPVTPVPSGTPVCYFGTAFGCNVSKDTRRGFCDKLISKIVAVGQRAVQAHRTIEGRAYALSTFVHPRFSLAFQIEDFTMGQIKHADAALHRLLWKPIFSFLRPKLVARSARDGGYGMPTLRGIFEATKLKMMARYAEHIRQTTSIDLPHNDHHPIPEWPMMLTALWRCYIIKRKKDLPMSLKRVMINYGEQLFFDPLVQTDNFARVPELTWPLTWYDAYKVLHDKTGNGTGELANLLREVTCKPEGNALTRPLLMTGHINISGFHFWGVYAGALKHLLTVKKHVGPVTVSEIPYLVRVLRSSFIISNDPTAAEKIAKSLDECYSAVVQDTTNLSVEARSRSYQYIMAYGTAAQASDGTALPFEQWMDISKAREFIEYDPKQMVFPTFSIQSPGLSTADPSWISIIRLNAPPEARSTIHRLALNRLPGRTPAECNCGVLDSVQHLLSECPSLGEFRNIFFKNWLRIAHKIVNRVVREENALSGRVNAAQTQEQQRPFISATYLRAQLPHDAPQLENWLALPFLRWNAFCNLTTPTAVHFNRCYELAAALFIHFRYVARNDLAYSFTRWMPPRFAIAFNRKFQQYANATIDRDLADRANELNQTILVNLLSPLANLQNRAITQGPTGLTFSSESAQSSADTHHFVPLLELALF